jgi:hypothetical protein
MVDRKEAARLCSMSPATYAKYAGKGLLPRMNAVGRVSIEAIRRAALCLDGLPDMDAVDDEDPAERALREWERQQS